MERDVEKQLHPVDIAVGLLAAEQDGYFTVQQAKKHGASDGLIHRRKRSGVWVVHAPSVLSHRGLPKTLRGELRVALLDAGDLAMASHGSAAALHGISTFSLTPTEILVPHGSYHHNVGTIHQSRDMPKSVTIDGFPATPLLRTVLDLGVRLGPVTLGRIIDELVASSRLTPAQLAAGAAAMKKRRRPGASTVEAALLGRTHGYEPSRSELERALDAIVATIPGVHLEREVNLPRRDSQPHRVDRLSRDPALIIEGDGRLWHARLATMEEDRRRDRAALLLGYPTVRYGWHDVTRGAKEVRRELVALLIERRAIGELHARSW